MTRSASLAMLAFGLLALSARDARAETVIEPASPRWGESITISVEPNRGANDRIERLRATIVRVLASDGR